MRTLLGALCVIFPFVFGTAASQTLTINEIEIGVSGIGLFPTPGAHIATTPCGMALVYLASGTRQKVIVIDDVGTVRVLDDRVISGNVGQVVALDTGEITVVQSDSVGTQILHFADCAASAAPTVQRIDGVNWVNGKWDLAVNPNGRRIYYFGTAGYLYVLEMDGTLVGAQQVMLTPILTNDPVPGAYESPQYFALMRQPDDRLGIIYNNATVVSEPWYNDIKFIWTPNANDVFGAVWGAVPHNQYSWFTLPMNPSFQAVAGLSVLKLYQRRQQNSLLLDAEWHGDRFVALWASAPGRETRFLADDDFRLSSASVIAMTVDGDLSGLTAQSARSHTPLMADGTNILRTIGGNVFRRRDGWHMIAVDHEPDGTGGLLMELVWLVSVDDGESWQTKLREPIPASTAGTGGFAHYIAVEKSHATINGDAPVRGALIRINAKPSEWANATAPVPPHPAAENPLSDILFFEISP